MSADGVSAKLPVNVREQSPIFFRTMQQLDEKKENDDCGRAVVENKT